MTIILLGISYRSAGADRRCPVGGGFSGEVTPERVTEFSNRHNLSLDQMVCCLPDSWRRNYVIASNSVSAQQSDPSGPRVILFQQRTNARPISSALSILRDAAGAPISEVSEQANIQARQHYSIEMMDQSENQIRFSDIRFERDMARSLRNSTEAEIRLAHQTVLQTNAQHCMSCHGTRESGQYPIFTFSPTWPNTFPKFYKPTVCPTPSETQSMREEQQQLLAAVRRPGTAYQCLPGIEETIRNTEVFDQSAVHEYLARALRGNPQENHPRGSIRRGQISDSKQNLVNLQMNQFNSPNRLALMTEEFENSMIELNHTQFVQRLTRASNYSKYKYSMAGALLGCFDPLNLNIEKWFPPNELVRQNGVRRPSPSQFAVLDRSTRESDLQRELTCRGAVANFQQDCFPENCPTTKIMAQNISALMARSQGISRDTPEGAAKGAMMRSIAEANLELRRNWQPAPGPEHRHPDPDSWGAFRYIMQTSSPQTDLTVEWSQIFTGGSYSRNVFNIGRQMMLSDPDLRRLDVSPTSSPCDNLARESLLALGGTAAPSATPDRRRGGQQ